MHRYKNLAGNSGVQGYEIGLDCVRVEFRNGCIYTYTHESAGELNVRLMKALATRGRGLSTFISTAVKNRHAHREEPDE
jgi:hypothetical protein